MSDDHDDGNIPDTAAARWLAKASRVGDSQGDLLTALAALLDVQRAILEATAGYRAECERQGFSPTVSEQMALLFHMRCLGMPLTGGA